ncbi:MAG: electron transfer flavoprotein subunit beta/FixA family protein [Thermodesulfobacteriota bacterium]
MKIFVCVKHVPDTAVNITIVGPNQIDESVRFIMNPYDEIAMAEAARIKSLHPGSEVVVVCLGKESAVNSIRLALALGADRGIFIKTTIRPDSALTARALRAVIQADGRPDLIFTGRHSIDSEGMQTGFRLAAGLGLPVVTNVSSLKITDGRAVVERDMEAGSREVIEVNLPCVIGAAKDLIDPPYPKLPEVMKARKKPIKEIALASLGLTVPLGGLEIVELETAQETRRRQLIKGAPAEMVDQFVEALFRETIVFESAVGAANEAVNHG